VVLRDRLKRFLSGTNRGTSQDNGDEVAVLAQRIKALKAAHTIEAAPQRARPNRAGAEEPVTARIRRRHEQSMAVVPSHCGEASQSTAGEAATPSHPDSSFQRRLTTTQENDGAYLA
jgi:hypothetical protein